MEVGGDNHVGADDDAVLHGDHFLKAAQELEDNPSLTYLYVERRTNRDGGVGPESNNDDEDVDDEDDEGDGQQRWRRQRNARAAVGSGEGLARFNDALERHRCIEKLYFWGDCFGGFVDDSEGGTITGRRELRRLFSGVMPRHRSLTLFSFEDYSDFAHDCIIPPGHLALLTEALSARERSTSDSGYLHTFCFENTLLDKADYRAIAAMIRSNAPVGCVKFIGSPNMDATDCQRICDGLLTNTNLHKLVLASVRFTVHRNTLRSAVGKESPLLSFALICPATSWTAEGIAGVIEGLRSNSTLERLELYDLDSSNHVPGLPRARPSTFSWAYFLEPVLVRHNYSPDRIELNADEPTFDDLLQKNAAVQKVHLALQQREYRMQPKSLWPRAMGRIADKPDLLYKFVRRANCHDLALHVASSACAGRRRKRRRPRDFQRG